MHEDLSRLDEVKPSSNRVFGFFFASLFLGLALWPVSWGGDANPWGLAIGAVLAIVAALRPRVLSIPNHAWVRFGALVGEIVSPLAMAIIFFGVAMPTGLMMRLLGKDPLRLRFNPHADSYWIERDPPGPPPESMKNQF